MGVDTVTFEKVEVNDLDLLNGFDWFFKGLVLHLGSKDFYRAAVKKSVGSAVLSFIVLMLITTIGSMIVFLVGVETVRGSITEEYAAGNLHVITIRNGVASTEGPRVHNYIDEDKLLVRLDIDGELEEIDRRNYSQSLLMTETEMHVLNNRGEYEVFDLSDLNTIFERDPLIIDEDSLKDAVTYVAGFGSIIYLIVVLLFNTFARFLYMVMWALLVWGVVAIMKKEIELREILIVGIYSYLASMIFDYLIAELSWVFAPLHTILMLIIWGVVLRANLKDKIEEEQKPIVLPSAGPGLAFLAVVAISLVWQSTLVSIALFLGIIAVFVLMQRRNTVGDLM